MTHESRSVFRELMRIERTGGLLVVALALVTAALRPQLAAGIALAGGLAVGNFAALWRLLAAMFRTERPPRRVALSSLLLLKLAAFGGAIYLCLVGLRMEPIGILLGLSCMVIAMLLVAIMRGLMPARQVLSDSKEQTADGRAH